MLFCVACVVVRLFCMGLCNFFFVSFTCLLSLPSGVLSISFVRAYHLFYALSFLCSSFIVASSVFCYCFQVRFILYHYPSVCVLSIHCFSHSSCVFCLSMVSYPILCIVCCVVFYIFCFLLICSLLVVISLSLCPVLSVLRISWWLISFLCCFLHLVCALSCSLVVIDHSP